jgi:hypothetical protein
MEKHSTYCAMMKLGMPIPDTWMVPPKEFTDNPDVYPTMERYGRKFELEEIGQRLGYPFFMKPYDGGAWVGVTRIDSPQKLRQAYQESGKRVMHLQKAVDPFDLFVRTIGIGPQVHIVKYDPDAPLHDRYKVAFYFVDGEEWSILQDTCLTINAFFGWEFNSCESLRKDGVFHPIDFANACPDFQVTSLHYHFPELVKNMVRWSLFCATTKRVKQLNLNWAPFMEIAKKDLPYRERLRMYAKIARERMEADAFQEFCEKNLSHLDEVAHEFFGTDVAKGYVRQKVAALFPAHEVHAFTEHYWGLVQFWRKTEADRMNNVAEAKKRAADAKLAAPSVDTIKAPEAPHRTPVVLSFTPPKPPVTSSAPAPEAKPAAPQRPRRPSARVGARRRPSPRRPQRRTRQAHRGRSAGRDGRPPRRRSPRRRHRPTDHRVSRQASRTSGPTAPSPRTRRWRRSARPGIRPACAARSRRSASVTTARRCCCFRRQAATPRSASGC